MVEQDERAAKLGLPWRELTPRQLLYLRHRLARHTIDAIADHYGCASETVRWHLKSVVRNLRGRSGLRIRTVNDVLILAAYDRVPPAPLPDAPPIQ